MEKFLKLFDEILEILAHAEDNKQITPEQREFLEANIYEAKEDIEKE
ncbi:MAG: hypothetical protein IJ403_10730 [Oscillospiraceae bacterium]|nr:hypothetical protein [Oscillospiraceae bacterium]